MDVNAQVLENTNEFFERFMAQEDRIKGTNISGSGLLDTKPIKMVIQGGILDHMTPKDLTDVMHEASAMQEVRATLRSFYKRDDNDNGFTKNAHRDALETIDRIYNIIMDESK